MSAGAWKAEKTRSHICDGCGKGFHSVHQLAQHNRIHTGEKPYKCSFCEKAFKQLSHLQQHTRLHTGERPYKCPSTGCAKSFIQLSNLNQHLKTHRNTALDSGTNVVCTFCARIFKTESSLLTHRCKPRKPNRPPAPGRSKVSSSTTSDDSVSAFEALDALPLGDTSSSSITNGIPSTNRPPSNPGSTSHNPTHGHTNGTHQRYNGNQPKNDHSSRSHSSNNEQSSSFKKQSSRSTTSSSSKTHSNRSTSHQQQQVLDDYANYGMNPMNGSRGGTASSSSSAAGAATGGGGLNLNDMLGNTQQQQTQQQSQQQQLTFESNFGSSFWSCPICKLNFSSEQGFSNHFEEMRMDHRHQMEAQLFLSAMVGQQQKQVSNQVMDQRNATLSFSSSRY